MATMATMANINGKIHKIKFKSNNVNKGINFILQFPYIYMITKYCVRIGHFTLNY